MILILLRNVYIFSFEILVLKYFKFCFDLNLSLFCRFRLRDMIDLHIKAGPHPHDLVFLQLFLIDIILCFTALIVSIYFWIYLLHRLDIIIVRSIHNNVNHIHPIFNIFYLVQSILRLIPFQIIFPPLFPTFLFCTWLYGWFAHILIILNILNLLMELDHRWHPLPNKMVWITLIIIQTYISWTDSTPIILLTTL